MERQTDLELSLFFEHGIPDVSLLDKGTVQSCLAGVVRRVGFEGLREIAETLFCVVESADFQREWNPAHRGLTAAEVVRGLWREARLVNRDPALKSLGGRPSKIRPYLLTMREFAKLGNPSIEVYPGSGVRRDQITMTMDAARRDLKPTTYQRLRRTAETEGLWPS